MKSETKIETLLSAIPHFEKRCLERLGFEVSQETLLEMLHDGTLEFMGFGHERDRLVFTIDPFAKHKDRIYFVYDRNIKMFVTVLVGKKMSPAQLYRIISTRGNGNYKL